MRAAYTYSGTAKKMFDDWGKTINVHFSEGQFGAKAGTGNLYIDFARLNDLTYINDKGKAVPASDLGSLIHELVHALTGRTDNISPTDFQGETVRFTNTIWAEMQQGYPFEIPRFANLDKQISYTASAYSSLQKSGYDYTNDTSIDAAYNVEFGRAAELPNGMTMNAFFNRGTGLTDNDFSSIALGNSKDLLIGGSANNKLYSGAGNDFLFGSGGNDILDGGADKDTAVYFGNKSDYIIAQNKVDGSWTIRSKSTETESAGTDKLTNIEYAQFDGGLFNLGKETVELKKSGLTFQKDIALVFDTTGSIVANQGTQNIEYLKFLSKNIIAAASTDGNDVRVGIVEFKDTTNGESSRVVLPFTDQDDLTERQAAVDAVFDNMAEGSLNYYGYDKYIDPDRANDRWTSPWIWGIKTNSSTATNSSTFTGGGDNDETPFDGLMLALSDSIGEWRYGAGTRQIVLFTDAGAKDTALASKVTTLAHSIGAEAVGYVPGYITSSDTSIDTFNLKFNSNLSSSTSATANNTIDIDSTAAEVQIFIVYLGTSGTDTTDYSLLANDNGGAVLNNPTTTELVSKLFTPNPNTVINGTANVDTLIGTDGNDTLYGLAGNDTIYGGTGDDIIYGGAGVDSLFSGAGNDIFRFNRSTDGIDKIHDFVTGSDRIEIASAGFGGSSVVGNAGVLDASMFSLGSSATTSSQRFIYNDTSGGLFFDADGIGGMAQVRLAQLVGNPTLNNDSFRII
ncbi:calcium-binding protein [Chamaesiphon sp. OTE_75_metabat_556]|uniref:calcium-binding protein n=1 Tax=Chamaesiphon sp. OTE_75_metabat_556 TaxID=2964692 RepID=UPI00286B9B60|nr:calcium-binding protein [Chamaesiphon sp. OTE_75_metabat_556]